MRTTRVIDFAEARHIVDAIAAKVSELSKAAVIVVADSHGELILFARMDGAPVSSIRIAMNKAYTAARERSPRRKSAKRPGIRKKVSTLPISEIPNL